MHFHFRQMDRTLLSRMLLLALVDIIVAAVAAYLALLIRLEFHLELATEAGFLQHLTVFLPLHLILVLGALALFRCYNSLWQYAGTQEFIRVVMACCCACVVSYVLMTLMSLPMPRSFPILNAVFLTLGSASFRLSYRVFRRRGPGAGAKKRTMLIGGGDAGTMALREFQHSDHSENRVVCVIDDDRKKKGLSLRGVPIVGDRTVIPEMVEKYRVEEIVFAIPTATPSQRREIMDQCRKTTCALKTIPALFQLVNGEVSVGKLRNIEIEDLLGRDSVQVDKAGITGHLTGKTILVTGGGGSIGSELCRQIADAEPGLLIIFDIYENNAYTLQQELKRLHKELNMLVLIGSVRDEARMEEIFSRYRPQLVYHAAAHKHVPLMEDSPAEAIKNNVFGTLNTARMAKKYGAEKFVLISTDKAVNPTNVMGASKRICEKVIEMVGRDSETDFVAVRFGNVLKSNGSVIPLFQQQIALGGPVTVTDPRIIRYFMTIPEAVSLVLQAGVFAAGGEIFILDMGEPVKIDDLARNMIRLSGLEPDVDIKIVYTGLRPGEKLYEELLLNDENMRKTANDLIYIITDQSFDDDTFREQLTRLHAAALRDDAALRELIHEIVPEFHEPEISAPIA